MKNKKGFTLTELLVVIVVLITLTTGSIYGIEMIQNGSEDKQLRDLIDSIEEATDVYLSLNPVYIDELLNDPSVVKCTKLYTLQNEGLLDINLINPKTKRRLPGYLCVDSKVVDGVIVNEFIFDPDSED